MSRRDDMESLAYSIMCLVDITLLPWHGIDNMTELTTQKKKFFELGYDETFMSGGSKRDHHIIKNLRETLLVYTRELKFEEAPDYERIKMMIEDSFKLENFI